MQLCGHRVREQQAAAAGGVTLGALHRQQDNYMAPPPQLQKSIVLLLVLCIATHVACFARPDGHAAARQARANRRLLAAATAPSSAANSSTTAVSVSDFKWEQYAMPGAEHATLIVVFRTKQLVHRFRPVCSHRERKWLGLRQQQQGATATAPSAAGTDVAQGVCATLLGSCRHLYSHAFAGLSGRFDRQQFDALQQCAGPDGIHYMERDGQVAKAEKDNFRNWWLNRPPAGTSLEQLLDMQQQQQQMQQVQAFDGEPPGQQSNDSLLSSVAEEATAAGQGEEDEHSPSLLTNSSSSSSPDTQQLWRWVLAEVGLAAQKQLASGIPSLTTVAALDGPSAAVAAAAAASKAGSSNALVSATVTVGTAEGPPVSVQALADPQVHAEADAADAGSSSSSITGSSSSSRVTKNQDPGLSVDANAIANPEILAFTPAAEAAAKAQSADQPQLLAQPQVEAANQQPGLKVQRLVSALWGLDRLDQRALPLDGSFSYGTATAAGTGKNVTIYMLDSGIKTTHQEFQPWGAARAPGSSRALSGPDFVDDDDDAADCDGHGTHVSSTAAGRSVGVARGATVMGVRVLDCDGAGSISNVVAALEWVADNAVLPAVASLSLGVPSGQWSRSLEAAVKNVIAAGITVVVAAGNSAVDACKVAPARVPGAITVGASNLPNKFQRTREGDTENLYHWSNTGACIDVFAPGVDIYGACGGPSRCEDVVDTAYTWASGTSMAAPHVTGMIAVYLETHPDATPADVAEAIVSSSTPDVIQSPLLLEGTPNRMLYSRGVTGAGSDEPLVLATGGPQG